MSAFLPPSFRAKPILGRAPSSVIRSLTRDYVVGEAIASGGSGIVHHAVRRSDGLDVALKLVRIAGREARRRWEREVGSLRRIAHPRVAGLIDAGSVEGTAYAFLATRFIPGPTFDAWLAADRPGRRALGCRIVLEVLEVLEAVHRAGLAHRDIKGSNVVLDISIDGAPILLDFGIAHACGSDETSWSRLTRPGALLATADYVAPERIKGELGDARADVWSVGILLYRVLYDHLPFHARTPSLTILRAVSEPIRPPWQNEADAPDPEKNLFEVVARALAKRPETRFESATEMAKALRAAMSPGVVDRLQASSSQTRDCDTSPLP